MFESKSQSKRVILQVETSISSNPCSSCGGAGRLIAGHAPKPFAIECEGCMTRTISGTLGVVIAAWTRNNPCR